MATSGEEPNSLRARLEFPVWYRSFTKTYSAWTNAPSDLKTPLLLSGSALSKAEGWLLFCPEKLTDSQKRFIARSIAQRAREPVLRSSKPVRKQTRWQWRRSSDRSLWHLYAVIAVGLWFFSPDFVRDVMERALNAPEAYDELKRQKVAGVPPGRPATPTQPVPLSQSDRSQEPAATVATDLPGEASSTGDELTTANPDVPSLAADAGPAAAPATDAAPAQESAPSKAARVAGLARDRLDAGRTREAWLLGIEAIDLAKAEDDGTLRLGSSAAGVLFHAMTTSERLAPLAERSAVSRRVRFCDEARGLMTIDEREAIAIWPQEGSRPLAKISRNVPSLDGVAFDRDCRLAAVPNEDFNLEIHSVATGQVGAVLTGHEAGILAASFSPDGRAVVTASQDSTARIWDARTGRQRAFLSGHDWHVVGAEFSPDGRLVLTASADMTARLWDAGTGRQLRTLTHRGVVATARFSGEGRHVMSLSWDGSVRIWQTASGDLLRAIAVPGGFSGAAISRDARHLATIAMDGGAQLWSVETGELLHRLVTSATSIRSVAFSPDGRWLATVTWDGVAELHDGASGQFITLLNQLKDKVEAVDFDSERRVVVAITQQGNRLSWPLFSSIEGALAQARSLAPPCLTSDERSTLGLEDSIPAWCSAIRPRGAALAR